jgi:hypothetical protein
MRYVLALYESPSDFEARANEDYWAAWQSYSQALEEAGVITGGAALQEPGTATTIRLQKGERVVHDGPFADSREQLGGFMIIDVENIDEALEWASKCPAAKDGAVEVRPVKEM